jgi:hypothetical protein
VHRQCLNNSTILPLWQIPNYLAYRKRVSKIADTPTPLMHLYQNVDQWRIAVPLDQVTQK